MQINQIKRPWEKKVNQGTRYSPDAYYQSSAWKNTRKSFRLGFTEHNGTKVPNTCCIDCFKETGRLIEGSNTDHIIQRKKQGSDDFSNLQTLCDQHHARKSAAEKNEMYKK